MRLYMVKLQSTEIPDQQIVFLTICFAPEIRIDAKLSHTHTHKFKYGIHVNNIFNEHTKYYNFTAIYHT